MSLADLAHVFPYTAGVNSSGHLELGGCDTAALAERFGTPLYIFDEETLRRRCREFLDGFRRLYPDTEVIYACKAFINRPLARLFLEEGLGLDVVSGGELAVALAAGFPPQQVYFHGNNKSREELEQALEVGIGRVVVDNFQDLETLEELAAARNVVQPVLVRLTPDVDPHTHAHTTTGVLDSKFGFPVATGQAEEAVRRALRLKHLSLVGLHFHLGSPIFELEPYTVAIRLVLEFASKLREEGLSLKEFSPGGGYAIAYTQEQRAPSPADYAGAITSALKESCQALGFPLPKLVLEPGRAIIGPAGVALYRVGAIKDIPGVRKYVAVDGGMGDNLRPALYGARYEAVVANRMSARAAEMVTIAGKYCESGDILIRDALLPALHPGDLVALPASGAYSPSMASQYNLNPRPAMLLVKDGHARLIRRRESPEDLMRCDMD